MSDIPHTPGSPEGPKPQEGPDTASSPHWSSFGITPRLLAAGPRVPPELMLTYMASALGGLAGRFARMSGFLGERHSPAIPLILSVGHTGRAQLLEQLVLEPALHFDDWNRRKVQVMESKWFDESQRLEGCAVRQAQMDLMHELEQDFPNADHIASARNTLLRHQQKRQPVVMLTSPDPSNFDQLRGSVFDESPLICDSGGRLIRNAILPNAHQAKWQQLLERITVSARQGVDQTVGTTSVETISSIRRTRTPFLIHLPSDLSGSALLHPTSANLFEVAVIVPTESVANPQNLSAKHLSMSRQSLENYRNAVKRVLCARLENSGVAFSLRNPIPALIEGQEALEDQLDGLPPLIRRYCGGLHDLPFRLLWTALVLDDPTGKNAPLFIPGVLATARWCIDRQVSLIRDALEFEQRRQVRVSAALMWRKLHELGRPCKLGDLQRKYHDQRRDQLEPILRFLVEQNLVVWDPLQNQIELRLPAVRPEWLEGGHSRIASFT